MTISIIMKKLLSRKLWLAVAGAATGIALALGVESSEVTAVAGAVTALVSVVTYIVTEGKIDAAAVKTAAEAARGAVTAVEAASETGGTA